MVYILFITHLSTRKKKQKMMQFFKNNFFGVQLLRRGAHGGRLAGPVAGHGHGWPDPGFTQRQVLSAEHVSHENRSPPGRTTGGPTEAIGRGPVRLPGSAGTAAPPGRSAVSPGRSRRAGEAADGDGEAVPLRDPRVEALERQPHLRAGARARLGKLTSERGVEGGRREGIMEPERRWARAGGQRVCARICGRVGAGGVPASTRRERHGEAA